MKKPGLFIYNETKTEAALTSSSSAKNPRDSVPVGKVRKAAILNRDSGLVYKLELMCRVPRCHLVGAWDGMPQEIELLL